MKKAAKRSVSRSRKARSKPKNSLLLFAILIIALVGVVVWAVIAKNPGKTPFALTPLPPQTVPSLSVNWKMPVGYVGFVDVGKKRANCSGIGITCSTATYVYWPGSKVDYFVRVNSLNGSVLQNGSTIATPDGRAVANWSWRYEVNVYPDSLGSCVAADAKCVKGLVNNNNPTVSYIAQNLLPSTFYRMIVCAPVCKGGTIIQNTTAKTESGTVNVYQATNLTILNQTCNSSGKVNVSFNWMPGQQAGFMVRESQKIDLSIANDNFASGHLIASNPPSKDATSYMTGQGQIGQLDSGKAYYWRINTHYLNENWHPSVTGTFMTKSCQQLTSWVLKEPYVSGNSVSFAFSPASNGNISLIVKNAGTGGVAFDSGPIASGKMSLQWNAQNGNYQAVLVAFGTANVSNTVSFSVSGIVTSPTPTAITCSQVDYDHDGSVSILDLTLMANANGTKVGDPKFNKAYDLNGDGVISRLDMDIASGFFGQKCLPKIID